MKEGITPSTDLFLSRRAAIGGGRSPDNGGDMKAVMAALICCRLASLDELITL